MRLYSELANWFHLLTAPSEYEEEAADYTAILLGALPTARTLLELGSGGGNNASYLKRRFTCTLSDLSEEMLALSRQLNPELEHLQGDMRTLRLARSFDAVFVHDAISYMTTLEDLARVAATAYHHTRPGGVALFLPDATQETFQAGVGHGGHDGADGRGLRYLEWTHPPQPGSTSYEVDFALLLRDPGGTRMVHDRHDIGLFSEEAWREVLAGAGFHVESPPLDPETHLEQVAFLCRRPL